MSGPVPVFVSVFAAVIVRILDQTAESPTIMAIASTELWGMPVPRFSRGRAVAVAVVVAVAAGGKMSPLGI